MYLYSIPWYKNLNRYSNALPIMKVLQWYRWLLPFVYITYSRVYDIEGNKKVQIYDYRFPKDMF